MKNALGLFLVIALAVGAGPQAWADFSIDQPPTEVPMWPAGPGDPGDIVLPGLVPVVDDGDGVPGGAPMTLMVPGVVPGGTYDTDGVSFGVPNDPFAPMSGAPPGVLVSIDDGDIGPGLGPPDNAVELFYSPLPPVGASTPTKATEAFLGLLSDPPPIGLDDDVDAYEDRIIPGPPGAFFSPDWDAPAGLDPGDIYFSPLVGGPPVLACDDFTQMWITPGDPLPAVDVDAVHLVPNAVCGMFPPLGPGPLCFLFSVDNAPPPPGPMGIDPGDIYITDCMNGSMLFLDDVTQMGLVPAPDEFLVFDIDAISVPDVGPGVCEFDGDTFFDTACGGRDCDDIDPNVNPGVTESDAAANCADGKDNDCDGNTDSADPDCTGGGCSASAAASMDGTTEAKQGSLFNLLAFLLLTGTLALGARFALKRRS